MSTESNFLQCFSFPRPLIGNSIKCRRLQAKWGNSVFEDIIYKHIHDLVSFPIKNNLTLSENNLRQNMFLICRRKIIFNNS